MERFKTRLICFGLIALFCVLKTGNAQNSPYDGVRYIDNCFFDIKYERNIVYGSNYTLLNELVDLKMDVYYSPSDTISKKQLSIYLTPS
jgi:hypothetical protein